MNDIERKKLFASTLVETGDLQKAQEAAGISSTKTKQWKSAHDVQLLVALEMNAMLQQAAPVAFNVLLETVKDKDNKIPHNLKLTAATEILDRAGYVKPRSGEDVRNPANRDLSRYSNTELESMLLQITSMLDAPANTKSLTKSEAYEIIEPAPKHSMFD